VLNDTYPDATDIHSHLNAVSEVMGSSEEVFVWSAFEHEEKENVLAYINDTSIDIVEAVLNRIAGNKAKPDESG
jgi:hypothetical protein